jgi:hypothetical protein
MDPAYERYVVQCVVHLQDGREEWARIMPTLDAALALINDDLNVHADKEIRTYSIYELGKVVPLRSYEEDIPQPPIRKWRVKLKEPRRAK